MEDKKNICCPENQVAPLGIVPLAGAKELSDKIEAHLIRWAKESGRDVKTFTIDNKCPRFSSGESIDLNRTRLKSNHT